MERLPSLAQKTISFNHVISPGAAEDNKPLPNSSVAIDVDSQQQLNQQQRRIPQVPPQFKNKKRLIEHVNVYEPTVVSLGPYHHGEPELRRAESFKQEALNMFINSAVGDRAGDKSFFLNEIMQQIGEIRKCYDGDVVGKYTDKALAEMMLRDGCFIIHHMDTMLGENMDKANLMWDHFTVCGISFISHDLLLLENQIPLRVVEILVTASKSGGDVKFDEGNWNTLLCRYASYISVGNSDHYSEPFWEQDPFHLLEIFRLAQLQMVVMEPRRVIFRWLGWPEKRDDLGTAADAALYKKINYQFRSVTDLKAKGIHIKAATGSSSIGFTSYPLYGELELVPWFVTHHSLVLFSNIIAYEMTSTSSNLAMTAYVNFMKSLIETAGDVKELREKGVLFGNLGGDDEVVKLFKDMDTLGWDNVDLFSKLKGSIGKHCSSKRKTWLAEFIITYFRSPWTAIALLAAFVLLCLTVTQTAFTIHPAKN